MTPLPYSSYKNLPPLAGLCTFEEAFAPGLPVEECVRRLKRIHYSLRRLFEILTSRITSEPVYELKTLFAHHAYLFAEHCTSIRQRVSEMREPPLGLDEIPHPALERYFDEIANAPTANERLFAVYQDTLGRIHVAIEHYLRETHPLTDAPSRRMLKAMTHELTEIREIGCRTFDAFPLTEDGRGWSESILGVLATEAGDIAGQPRPYTKPLAELPRKYSGIPPIYDPIPQRDERFTDLWNQGVNAESFLYDETQPARAKALMMLFKRLREIDVPEMMASIMMQTSGKPWAYYRDMSRQLWDEARHAMMGEVGFVALGVDWTKAKITWNWSYRLNTECSPLERHGVLFFIEQGLMPRTGKRYEYEVATLSGIPLVATIQDFDWADEVLHSQIGRAWYVTQFPSLKDAMDYGDQAWSKIISNWTTVSEMGLTNHANWWPAIYTQACRAEGVAPDPRVLAFDETYEGKRADVHRRD
ncbi:MAG: hypothetical protein U0798_06690 [Gemmataceae bacterium]